MYPTPFVTRGMSEKEKGNTPKITFNLEKVSPTMIVCLKTNTFSTYYNVINTFYL
jgi:hypothetical protein